MTVEADVPVRPLTRVRTGRATRPGPRGGMTRPLWWLVCSLVLVLFLYPLWAMITQALKDPTEAVASPATLVPHSLTFANFRSLAGSSSGLSVVRAAENSLLVATGATLATVVLAVFAGYAFAKLRFPGSNIVFFVSLATFMIPFQAIITPLFLVLQHLHLQNTLVGLGAVYTTFQLPFGIFLMRNSFASVPSSLEEAARIDGCGTLTAMWRVSIPVAVPGIVTTVLLTFFSSWNEFFAALILITDQSKYTLPISLSILSSGQFGTINWGVLQAGVAVTIIPCVAIYLILQRYYVAGLLAGAVK